MTEHKFYSKAMPVDVQFHGVCYYCGCEAESKFNDFSPKKSDLAFYLQTRETCSFAIVQCCKECFEFLINCRIPVIEQRKKHVNKSIKKKYKRALNIYECWNEDEFEDLSPAFIISIKAGITLGKEAFDRIQFAGYKYEINGTIHHINSTEVKTYTVFGEAFDHFRDALQHASKSYRININTLKQCLIDNNIDFDEAITAYHEKINQTKLEKELHKISKIFALKHKQNIKFVKSTLRTFLVKNPHLSKKECLELIYQAYIKK